MTVRSVLKNALKAIGRGLRVYWGSVVAYNKGRARSAGHSRDDDPMDLWNDPVYSKLPGNIHHYHSEHGSAFDD